MGKGQTNEPLFEENRFRRMSLDGEQAGESWESLVKLNILLLEGMESVKKTEQEGQKRKNRGANNPWLFSCLKGLTVA